tara:strand:+ start:2203 stop:2343 length:141 start_codon:yes stop_codon:yes gene_type:complete
MIENSLTTENIPKDLLSIFKKVIKEERISEQEGLPSTKITIKYSDV